MNKLWMFRFIATGVPSLIGLAIIAYMLYDREQIVVADGTVRIQAAPIYVQEEGHEKTGHKYLYDAKLGWRNIPSWNATTFGKPLTTNSKGLRDSEYRFEKPPSTRRILVLGDSFAWGYGVGDKEVFTEVLEQRLTTQASKWEVLNSGVSGWGTDQQLLYFLDEGKMYSPDVVVVAFYLGNDPINCASSQSYQLNKPVFLDLSLTLANVPVPKPPAKDEEAKRSRANPYSLAVRILEELAVECDKLDAELVVMKFGVFQAPSDPKVGRTNDFFQRQLGRIRSRLHYLDLDQAFTSYTKLQLTEGVDDGHWNPFGHRVVAEVLERFLIEQQLLN